ncbi:hypothetical protein OQ279_03845 [Salinimicrobium sp. MT39]|uniref:Uncharacterized protein n=1 Tax=Salinimicrobium profundisediminis TaxID=2994553 RepID=A0A9X3I087_9FLAO|nr:hypothetical protein [Salinimicrobium profundisediminis]MCX2837274.1 hypothetical protein [Salinimicrobium profundisediminis]
MKINSDLIWALALLAVAAASFFLGMNKEKLKNEELLEERLAEIEILEKKNQQLSEELTSRGIYSYPQATVVSKLKAAVATVLISLNGQDPIPNLKLRRNVIFNYSGKENLQLDQKGKFSDLGTLKPHNPSAFDIPLEEKEIALHLEFDSKKNQWHQYIWIKTGTNGDIATFWVITNENSAVIDKHIDPEFPTDEEEKVLLWKGERIHYSDLKMNSIFPPNN